MRRLCSLRFAGLLLLSTLGALGLVGCGASEVQSRKLRDGSWYYECALPMDECIRRVQQRACRRDHYRIIEGTSETRLRDAPPFERPFSISRLHLSCTNDDPSVLTSVDAANGDEPASDAADTKAAPAKAAAACTLGQTRECVGAAACKGGQACLADGSGFGACDCGPVSAPAAATASPNAVPVDAAAPAVTTP